MKNVSEFLVGCASTVNNAGWLAGASVVYKIKFENEILQVEGIGKNKNVIYSKKIDVRDIKYVGQESEDIYYIDSKGKKINMHTVEQNKNNVEELINILKEYGIKDNSQILKTRKRIMLGIYSLVIVALGLIMFL